MPPQVETLATVGFIAYTAGYMFMILWYARANGKWLRALDRHGRLYVPNGFLVPDADVRRPQAVSSVVGRTRRALRMLRQREDEPELEQSRLITLHRGVLMLSYLFGGLLTPILAALVGRTQLREAVGRIGTVRPSGARR